MARTASGTLRLSEDANGLKYEFDAPNTTLGNDLLEMIRRGDVNQSSFGFTVDDDTWEERDGKMIRTINKVKKLYDVSPVTYPAYHDATVAVRNLRQQKETEETKEEEIDAKDLNGELRNKIVKAAILKHA